MPRNVVTSKATTTKRKRDENAPKSPGNAYTIFYKHFQNQFLKKNPGLRLDGRELTVQTANAWKLLTPDEKRTFQEAAAERREQYNKEMEAYKRTPAYRQYIAVKQKPADAKRGDVEVFSSAFVAYNKNRESELRALRRKITMVEDEMSDINDEVDKLKEHLDRIYAAVPSARKLAFEKDRQMLIWCRELVCLLDKQDMLPDLGLEYNSSPHDVVHVLEEALENSALEPRVRKSLSNVVLEYF